MKKEFKLKTRYIYTDKGIDSQEKVKNSEVLLATYRIIKSINESKRKEGVYAHSSAYSSLFNKKLAEVTGEKRFVKITNPETKKSIWRVWNSITTDELGSGIQTKDILYLDQEGKFVLTGNKEDSDDEEPITLKFSQAGTWSYFLHCRDKFNKSSYQIALVSLAMGFISLVL